MILILRNAGKVVLAVRGEISFMSSHYAIPDSLPISVFRAYDIRGVVRQDGITVDLAYAVGRAVGSDMKERNLHEVIVGRDGRLTGKKLTNALSQGLCDSGVNVCFIGIVPSPVLYFATCFLSATSGVMVTASHNPHDENGFKIVLGGETLSSSGIDAIQQRIRLQNFTKGSGKQTTVDINNDYVDYIAKRIILARPLNIVVDCGNGAAGYLAPKLYRALGCTVHELFCDVDGNFPNHHPDPSFPENLNDLIMAVKNIKADLGLAFDGDADRLGVVTDQGEIIWPDRQMMLFSQEVLSNYSKAKIIFDVKCSNQLPQIIKQAGGYPLMWHTGHSLIKAKLSETNAPLAGEMSGHIFFNDEWFGFDDGLYVGARLLRILSKKSQSSSQQFSQLPNSINTPELKLPIPETEKKHSCKICCEKHVLKMQN